MSAPEDPRTGRAVRIAIDADCPGCGYPERSYDTGTGLFGCSSLNPEQCDTTTTTREGTPDDDDR